jgi:putative endonuclease
MYTTYILFSNITGRYYTGQTIDLNRRMEEHNRGKTPFLARGCPWIIVFSRQHQTRKEAIKLEKYIKKRGAERFLSDLNTSGG